MNPIGAFTFVLHSHIPYARLAGRWPHGEEWIHEAATETYIPLLQTLYDLKEEGIDYKLTIGLTPVLAEQLVDPLVLDHLEQYLEARIVASEQDLAYYLESEDQRPSPLSAQQSPQYAPMIDAPEPIVDPHLHYLAGWYRDWYTNIKTQFIERFNRDIIGAFKYLQDSGHIEIMTSAATHGYLPLLGHDSAIHAQIVTGINSYKRLFGKAPTSFWLPECAYRPAYVNSEGKLRTGIEKFLAEQGIKVFFTETHTITGGQPVGVAAGDVIGPYGVIKRRYVIPASPAYTTPKRNVNTFHAYHVSDTTKGIKADSHSDVAVIGRNNRTGQQVWSSDWGYPGDFDYREFHKKAGTSGLQYWRVTGAKTDLAHKDYYQPEWAAIKIDQHAEHFAHLVGDILREYENNNHEYGLISSNYDTELFGHWWFEGVLWLGKVLRHLAHNPDIELTTATQYVTDHPPTRTLHLPEGSWGANGTHFTWDNGETHWMWQPIYESEARMEELVEKFPNPTDDERFVLNQCARELLLLQSSDWTFLVTTGQAREYAIQRFSQHVQRFKKLADSLDAGTPNRTLAEEYYKLDNLFPDIDYQVFKSRE